MKSVYEAITEMRELTERNVTFSFSYMSCDLSAGKSHGIVEVRHGQLRKRAKGSDILMEYYDFDTNEDRRFYLPLLLTFNKEILELE